MAHQHWPLFDLRVRSPRLELRYPDDDMICEIMEVAARGIHDPDYMPFSVPWTDSESPEFERKGLQHFWNARASLTPDDWALPMAVVVDGGIVGVQSVGARQFQKAKVVHTGSWLGRAFQGQGLGKEMRAAVLHLAFAGLGAQQADSAAWDDNDASLRVSAALGYEENGDATELRRGEPDRQIRLKLTRARWEERRRDDIDIVGLDRCLDLLGLTPLL